MWSHEALGVDVDNEVAARDAGLVGMGEHLAENGVEAFARGGFQNQVKAVYSLDARDGSGTGAEDAYALRRFLLEPLAEGCGPGGGLFEFGGLHEYIGEDAEGRVVHPATVLEFALDEAGVVVRGGGENGVVIGVVGLYYNAAGKIAAAGAAGDLGH